MSAPKSIPEEPRQKLWGDFFVRARLYPFLDFDDFMRDPEGILASLTDPQAPTPAAMPRLRERINAWLPIHRPRIAA